MSNKKKIKIVSWYHSGGTVAKRNLLKGRKNGKK